MSQTETTAPGPETSLESRDWYFTFGLGHRLYVGHRSAPKVPKYQGIDLDGYYVVIHGEFREARIRMMELFGECWAYQYAELPVMPNVPGWTDWKELIKVPPIRESGPLRSLYTHEWSGSEWPRIALLSRGCIDRHAGSGQFSRGPATIRLRAVPRPAGAP